MRFPLINEVFYWGFLLVFYWNATEYSTGKHPMEREFRGILAEKVTEILRCKGFF